MELRSKKRLLNTRQLPGYDPGKDGFLNVPPLYGLKFNEDGSVSNYDASS